MRHPTIIVRFLARLDQDRSAALAPVFGFILLFFAWGMMTILNTGQVAYDRMRLQNTADTVALAQGDEVARSLNVLSMNNMALTQMLVVSAVSFTVVETIAEIEGRSLSAQAEVAEASMRNCVGPPLWVVACEAAHVSLIAAIGVAEVAAANVLRRYRPDRGLQTSQSVIGALNDMNRHLVESMPRRSGETIRYVLGENGADAAFIYPPCSRGRNGCEGRIGEGAELPVERDGMTKLAAFKELCDSADAGSDGFNRRDFERHGYLRMKGPYAAGGSAARPHLRDHVNNETGFAWMLPYLDTLMRVTDSAIRYSTPPKFSDSQTADDNIFTEHQNDNWSTICGSGGLLSTAVGAVSELPEPYWLTGRSLTSAMLPTGGLLTDFDDDTLRFLAVVAQTRGVRLNPENFGERNDAYQAYAEAQVYNTESYDLFTAQWRSRLVPASFMDRPAAVAEALDTVEGADLFNIFRETVRAAPDSAEWAFVNTH